MPLEQTDPPTQPPFDDLNPLITCRATPSIQERAIAADANTLTFLRLIQINLFVANDCKKITSVATCESLAMRNRCFLWWPTVLIMLVGFAPAISLAAEPLPRSVLIVTQWDAGLPWYAAVSSAFHATLRANSAEPVAVYTEAFDLSRFHSPQHQENFRRYLREKYREQDIGVIVAVGPLALEFMLGARSELWSRAVPIVFNSVDESTVAQMKLPADVTGRTAQLTLRDMVRHGAGAGAKPPTFRTGRRSTGRHQCLSQLQARAAAIHRRCSNLSTLLVCQWRR